MSALTGVLSAFCGLVLFNSCPASIADRTGVAKAARRPRAGEAEPPSVGDERVGDAQSSSGQSSLDSVTSAKSLRFGIGNTDIDRRPVPTLFVEPGVEGILRRRPSGVRPRRTGVFGGRCLSMSSGLSGPANVTLRRLLAFRMLDRRKTLLAGVLDLFLAEAARGEGAPFTGGVFVGVPAGDCFPGGP